MLEFKETAVPNTKTHFPQVPLETVKRMAEEQDGEPIEPIEKGTPEQLRGPAKKAMHGKSSVQAKPESEDGEVL